MFLPVSQPLDIIIIYVRSICRYQPSTGDLAVEMDAVGPPKLTLPEAICVVPEQLRPFTGFEGVEGRVAEYRDVSTRAVIAQQGLRCVSARQMIP